MDEAIARRRIWRIDPAGAAGASDAPGAAGASDAPGAAEASDALVVEAPLELRVGGAPRLVLMRTPGHDQELAAGLLWSEGVVTSAAELADLHAPAGLADSESGNVLELGEVDLPERPALSVAGCGVCGKRAIAELELRSAPNLSDLTVPAALLADLPERLRAAQTIFERTGGLHAAAAFDAGGRLLALREDVGRHNAVDKLVGWALGAGRLPAADAILCVSGRLGFEIVQKAVVAGFPIIVAVSAPSSLAVDVAERFRLTLCGFVRGGAFNVYSHPGRVAEAACRLQK